MMTLHVRALAASVLMASAVPALAVDDVHFSTGNVDSLMGMASRPSSTGKTEIEAADDFVLANETIIDKASFIGLLTGTAGVASVGNVGVEIYRVFPLDSTVPPSGNVPTRVNSPSDVAFDARSAAASNLTFGVSTISANFTASNSVLTGINKSPNQTTGGEGSANGSEVRFDITFTTPLDLPAGHYFFVPQVQETGGEFYWLSSVRPIVSPGTPFAPDLQAWVRNENLDPDWLRVGTDIVGGTAPPTFNGQFTLDGATVPEPASIGLLAAGGLVLLGRRSRK